LNGSLPTAGPEFFSAVPMDISRYFFVKTGRYPIPGRETRIAILAVFSGRP
jgi:hypothetical protein